MKRDVSTSTIGRDEARRPLMKAYLFQRRVLFSCSCLMVLSLILWIIAISTDHWIMITGRGGIFIPETRRFFLSSHSGLWRFCRHTSVPNALTNAKVIRNFTSIAYQNPNMINEAKRNCSKLPFIKDFREEIVDFNNNNNFTEAAKRRMFAHWVRKDEFEFETFKKAFHELILSTQDARNDLYPIDAKAIPIDALNVKDGNKTFGKAFQEVLVNSTLYYFVIPELAHAAIFKGWNEKQYVPKLFWPFARDLGLPAFVLNDDRVILQLMPPKPPKNKQDVKLYDYVYNPRCKYIDMFPNDSDLRMEPGFDWTLLDYIRTEASFACITVFVMCLGSVFSFYTFKNPRYMFKRLAGGIDLVAASTVLVVLQVLFASVEYTKEHLFYAYPDGAELTYGYGVYLAWFTFAVNFTCGILFMWYSGKKKGSKAPTDEIAMADEPTIMGR